MKICIIVEGKNDVLRLKKMLTDEVLILCSFGIPSTDRMEQLLEGAGDLPVYLLTDNDDTGRRIRAVLRDIFPDAEHIYTNKGYAGVEGTPEEYLLRRLEKAGLEEFIALRN